MIFLSGIDDIASVPIAPGVPARIAQPTPAGIAPPTNDGTIGPIPQAAIVPGLTGAIARGPGSNGPYGGIPITRRVGPVDITGPTAPLPAFPVPGAGMQAKTLGPLSIMPGPSGDILDLSQASAIDPRQRALNYTRDTIQPIIDALAEVPADQRQAVLQDIFEHLGQPDAEPAIRRLSAKYIAKGSPASIAFKEAFAHVLATAFYAVAYNQYMAAKARAVARADAARLQNLELNGLGAWYNDAWNWTKKTAKKVAKVATKVAHKIADWAEDAACSTIGKTVASGAASAFGAPPGTGGPALCGAAKTWEFSTGKLAYWAGSKTKNPSFKQLVKKLGGEVVDVVVGGVSGNLLGGVVGKIKLPPKLDEVVKTLAKATGPALAQPISDLAKQYPQLRKLTSDEQEVVRVAAVELNARPEIYAVDAQLTLAPSPPSAPQMRDTAADNAAPQMRDTAADEAAPAAKTDRVPVPQPVKRFPNKRVFRREPKLRSVDAASSTSTAKSSVWPWAVGATAAVALALIYIRSNTRTAK